MMWVLLVGLLLGALLDMLFFQRYNDLERNRLRRENQRLKWHGLAKDAAITELETKVRLRNTKAMPPQGPRTWDVPQQPTWPPIES